jgi:hypothetical protein
MTLKTIGAIGSALSVVKADRCRAASCARAVAGPALRVGLPSDSSGTAADQQDRRTADKYSNTGTQRLTHPHVGTPCEHGIVAKAMIADSSGRRGRGFKSRHPDKIAGQDRFPRAEAGPYSRRGREFNARTRESQLAHVQVSDPG